jgi:hypothetical protein
VLAFPIACRRDLVHALAEQMAVRPLVEAEKHLQLQLRRQAKVLARKQLPDDVIAHQVRRLELAVRAELFRLVLTPPRPSGAA